MWPFWTEIGITEHNFGSWPPKDHRWHVCYIGLLISEEKILKHFFPLGPMLKLCGHLGWRSRSPDTILRIDHPCHACFKLAYWFQRRRFLRTFLIGSYVKTMSTDFESWPSKDHSCHACFKLAYWFQRKFLLSNIFPIVSYVKIMYDDGGHLGWRSGSQDIILKVDHLRTIHAMFALNWLTDFRGEEFKTFLP